MRPPFLDPSDPDPADGLSRGSLDHPLWDYSPHIMPSSRYRPHAPRSSDDAPSRDDPSSLFFDDERDADREQALLDEEFASYNEDSARSDEEGWFYSDDD